MKNLKELVSTVYNICISANSPITSVSPFALLEKQITEYSKGQLIEFAKHLINRINLGENFCISDIEKVAVDFLNESSIKKLFDEKVMKFIEDKDVKQVIVSYKVYERFKWYSKLGVSEDLTDNEIIIDY